MASLCIAKATTMTGHMRERTPLGLALMNQPSRLPSLAPLASQGLHTSPPPPPPKAGHHKEKPPQASSLALDTSWSLGLLSRHASLACWLARASSRLHLRPANLGRGHLMVPSFGEQASLAWLTWQNGTCLAGHLIISQEQMFELNQTAYSLVSALRSRAKRGEKRKRREQEKECSESDLFKCNILIQGASNGKYDSAYSIDKKVSKLMTGLDTRQWSVVMQNCETVGGSLQEETLRKAKCDLVSAEAEQDRYVKVAIPVALEEARAQAMEDFLQSEDFNSKLIAEYQEGMRDMKAGFTAANPSLVGVDWSFVLAESEETATEEVPKEGEVSGAARAPEDVVILDDQEEPAAPEQPVVTEQPGKCCVLLKHLISVSARALPILVGAWSWDLTPWSENHRSWGICKGRSYLGTCSSTSNSGRYPIVGPYSVVQETQEFGGSARADLGSCSDTYFRSNLGSWGSAREDLILSPARASPFVQYPVVGP
ncbi:hypothetical protein TIFTF001_040988 [Ficus carica]|uniref:Uncharacterized protein n=1 Tax=Ficus carica TaxID=3494 RepID=A0AA87Z778_FICCA|nr:hypothetical protein TIFTF001_040978 [Ficus carica]GMN27171.1 hypothetical protein TIFTF001_040988 [Ficus carica]